MRGRLAQCRRSARTDCCRRGQTNRRRSHTGRPPSWGNRTGGFTCACPSGRSLSRSVVDGWRGMAAGRFDEEVLLLCSQGEVRCLRCEARHRRGAHRGRARTPSHRGRDLALAAWLRARDGNSLNMHALDGGLDDPLDGINAARAVPHRWPPGFQRHAQAATWTLHVSNVGRPTPPPMGVGLHGAPRFDRAPTAASHSRRLDWYSCPS
jgi:hypothetical protein